MSRSLSSDRRARRRVLAMGIVVLIVGALIAVVGVGGTNDRKPPPRKAPRPFTVGTGARSARVFPARGRQRRATVVFLHGWGLTGPKAYSAWLHHLTARGSTVIVPRYQSSLRTSSETVPDNALTGIRAALRRLRPRPRSVVVAGHSVGGILAVDYATRAESLGLPAASAVMIVFPGGAIRDMAPVPEEDPARIPASIRRFVVLMSPADQLVGTATAESIYAGALDVPEGRRQLVSVDDPSAGDHFAPVLDSPAARTVFWARLDRLVRLAG